jgi:hypothetical protein
MAVMQGPLGYLLYAAVLVTIIFLVSRWRAANAPPHLDARYLIDRQNPLRAWAHGALSAYRGVDAADPGYWKQKDALAEMANWSTPDRKELLELLSLYEDKEINVAFDKARIVWLARTGFATGWLDEQESWEYVRRAAMASQATYSGWDDFAEAVIAGAVEWNRDVGGNPMSDEALRQRRARAQEARAKIWPSTPFKAAMG